MRILHVIPQLCIGNGAARILKDLAGYQVTHGNLVTVVSLSVKLPSYDKDLEDLGCKVVYLENRRFSLYNPKFFFQLKKIIKEYDIVHVHLFSALYWVALAKCFSSASCKLVLTEHSTFNNRQSFKILKPIEKFIYSRYDAIVAVSNGVYECFRYYLGDTGKWFIINNGIKINDIQCNSAIDREKLNVPDSATLIVQVAKFESQKDQKTLIKALSFLSDDFYAVFVGNGSLLAEHKKLTQSLHLSDRVIFLGMRDDVYSILKASDIVVMASHFEGFGLAAVEGMAAGKPIVASNVDGLRDVVANAGILFRPKDEVELASCLLKLKKDKNYYYMIADKCKQRSLYFSSEKMSESYLQLYNKLL
ncbi:glycosyltransferase [Parabacteroides gordonii]|uniref:glycosyltransferase n=1 Tax=Parabacteroides gordonii TaxID=574930 RepID=UPI00241CF046|nr:glycosyltransferase [Parabacteroides gordonii]